MQCKVDIMGHGHILGKSPMFNRADIEVDPGRVGRKYHLTRGCGYQVFEVLDYSSGLVRISDLCSNVTTATGEF